MKLDPFAQWGKVFESWQTLAEGAFARAQAFQGEMEKAESKRVERVESAIEEIAKLQKETLAYNAQLGAEFRKLSLEAVQSATALMTAGSSAS